MSHLNASQLVLVDESETHVGLTPLYGRAPKGQRTYGQAPHNRGKKTTLLATLLVESMQAPWSIEGAIDTLAFETYMSQVLAPTLKAGQIRHPG